MQLRWSGDEDATVWPSLTARILVVPDAADQARLAFLTPRSPRAELATRRLGRVHRERVVDVAVQRFLLELADRLADPETGRPVGSPLTRFDRRPIFVHHARTLDTDPQALVDELLADLPGLATDTTAHALAASDATLVAGRFRRPPAPTVQVAPTPPGTLGVVDLAWTSDEEATGWPQIGLTLAVEAAPGGSRLVVLSRRVPGYDLSSNRVDKHQRDQILRELGSHVADATVRRLPTPDAAPRPQPATAAA